MKPQNAFLILISLFIFMGCQQQEKKQKIVLKPYPEAKIVDTTDVYFGHEVKDPYRWLEDDNSDETAEWVKQENEVTFDYLGQIPFRDKIKSRLEQIWDYPKYSVPFKEGDNYYFFKNSGMQNQSVLYKQTGLDAEPEVFLIPILFRRTALLLCRVWLLIKRAKM